MRSRRLLLIAVVAAFGVSAASSSAATTAPCWKRVIQDWVKDGVVSQRYSPHCLRQAIKHTPEDLRDYSSIVDDFNAALLDATSPGGGSQNGPNNGSSGNPSSGSGPSGAGSGVTENAPGAQPQSTGKGKRVVTNAGTPASAPDDSRPIPIPLIVLGAVLLAGALAAASPALVRRLRTRFPRVGHTADSVRPQS
jgi:hypothetical protein